MVGATLHDPECAMYRTSAQIMSSRYVLSDLSFTNHSLEILTPPPVSQAMLFAKAFYAFTNLPPKKIVRVSSFHEKDSCGKIIDRMSQLKDKAC